MTNTEQQIEELGKQAHSELAVVQDAHGLEAWRVKYIGRSGKVPEILRNVKNLSDKEKRVVGKEANALRRELEEAYAVKQAAVSGHQDKGLPRVAGRYAPRSSVSEVGTVGHLHPLTLTINRIIEIFAAMGFEYVEGPEVEEAKYNFDQLNISPEHPTRAESDTFYIQDHPELVLRTHVSPLQIRGVLEHNFVPPFKFVYAGRTFRFEKPDATHESTFHQFEFMVVHEDASLAELKYVIQTLYSTFFQKNVNIRLRPSFFPFVEPGFEIDITCPFCTIGCRICKNSKWIELGGAGMVHPNVLKNVNVDPDKYRGYAMGAAIDRLAMLQYGIDDIRLFWSGDTRFLRQFS